MLSENNHHANIANNQRKQNNGTSETDLPEIQVSLHRNSLKACDSIVQEREQPQMIELIQLYFKQKDNLSIASEQLCYYRDKFQEAQKIQYGQVKHKKQYYQIYKEYMQRQSYVSKKIQKIAKQLDQLLNSYQLLIPQKYTQIHTLVIQSIQLKDILQDASKLMQDREDLYNKLKIINGINDQRGIVARSCERYLKSKEQYESHKSNLKKKLMCLSDILSQYKSSLKEKKHKNQMIELIQLYFKQKDNLSIASEQLCYYRDKFQEAQKIQYGQVKHKKQYYQIYKEYMQRQSYVSKKIQKIAKQLDQLLNSYQLLIPQKYTQIHSLVIQSIQLKDILQDASKLMQDREDLYNKLKIINGINDQRGIVARSCERYLKSKEQYESHKSQLKQSLDDLEKKLHKLETTTLVKSQNKQNYIFLQSNLKRISSNRLRSFNINRNRIEPPSGNASQNK